MGEVPWKQTLSREAARRCAGVQDTPEEAGGSEQQGTCTQGLGWSYAELWSSGFPS